MSRTDSTNPERIRGFDMPGWARIEMHRFCENDTVVRSGFAARRGVEVRKCDLGNLDSGANCYYTYRPKYYTAPPTRKDKRLFYYKPQRQYSRRMLDEARWDYNTYGETDIEPHPYDTQTPWLGGWWD